MPLMRTAGLRSGWFAMRYLSGDRELTFPLHRMLPAPYSRRIVDRATDVCIDGLPRSANSFGTLFFQSQNPGALTAHHTHVPAQFRRAVRLGVPCAILVREPLATLTSLLIAYDRALVPSLAFRVYTRYYRQLAEVRDRLAICRFEEVVADPTVIARRLNGRYGTAFIATPATPAEIDELVGRAGSESESQPSHGIVPNAYKESRKPAVRAELEAHPRLALARSAYAAVVQASPQA